MANNGDHQGMSVAVAGRHVDDAHQSRVPSVDDRRGGTSHIRQLVGKVFTTVDESRSACGKRCTNRIGADGSFGIVEARREPNLIQPGQQLSLRYQSSQHCALGVGKYDAQSRIR